MEKELLDFAEFRSQSDTKLRGFHLLLEILFLEIKMAETRQRSLIGLRNARQEQNEKIIQFLLRVSVLAHSAYAPSSLAETVVLAQNCVREPMKNAIRNSKT